MIIRRCLGSLLATATLAFASIGSVQAGGPYKVTLAGGSVGGAWSAIGTAIGEVIKTSYPGSSFTYEPGREAGNLALVSSGKVQLGIAHAQMALRAEQGLTPFTKPLTNIRAIALIDPQAAVQILATQSSNIKSLEKAAEEKRPLRVSLNQKGTLMAITGEAVLAAYGLSVEDIERWGGRVTYGPYNAGLDQMKNNQSDLIINMLSFPSSQIVNASRDVDLQLLGLSNDKVEALDAELGTQPIKIPAKTYDFQTKAIQTITGNVIVFASTDMSDDEAADLVRALLNNFKFLQSAHATLARLSPKALTDTAPIPLHPGAIKAYQEAGLLP